MSVKRPVDREAVSLRPRLRTPDPLREKARDKPLDERVWRVAPRTPTADPTKRPGNEQRLLGCAQREGRP